MRAIVVSKPGSPEVLELKERDIPACKEGWSLVKVKGFGINHSEIFTRQGLSPSVQFPRILGIECVGVIAETTDELRLPKGQCVVSIMGEMGRAFDGSYAEYVLLPNEQIYPVETSSYNQVFFLEKSRFFNLYISANEPQSWIFRCIRY